MRHTSHESSSTWYVARGSWATLFVTFTDTDGLIRHTSGLAALVGDLHLCFRNVTLLRLTLVTFAFWVQHWIHAIATAVVLCERVALRNVFTVAVFAKGFGWLGTFSLRNALHFTVLPREFYEAFVAQTAIITHFGAILRWFDPR